MGQDAKRIPVDRFRKQIASVLEAWGLQQDLVETTTDALVYADVAGIDSHGISLLSFYEGLRRAGKLNVRARPHVVRESPATALVDADAGIGHPGAVFAMRLALEKALASGVAVVSVFNSHHFGAAGYYAAMAPQRGLVGLVTSTTRVVCVVPTRSAQPMLGTNPIAFAAPARRNRPFLLDIATSTAAGNKVRFYDMNHKPVPAGWVADEHGESVQEPARAFSYANGRPLGGLTPLGGTPEGGSHKGYGLGMMAQILSSALSGGSFSPIRNKTQKPGDPDNVGHFFLAIDPRAFRAEGLFEEHVDAVVDEIHRAKPTDPALPVLVAGDPEEAVRRDRLEHGIPTPPGLAENVREVCVRCGAPFLLDDAVQEAP